MGNHDFDFGVEHLVDNCVKKCDFPWLLSNAYDKETGKFLGMYRSHVILVEGARDLEHCVSVGERLAQGRDAVMLEHGGWKIGLMGLIEEEWLLTLSTIEREEVDYYDFVGVARDLNKRLRKEGADIVIALTHMRTPNDMRLANEVPEIDLILGGHDHDEYSEVTPQSLRPPTSAHTSQLHRVNTPLTQCKRTAGSV